MLDAKTETDLRADLGAGLITPESPQYDQARQVWNGMIDRRPAAITRVRMVSDIQAALAAARESGLAVSVRGGGHNIAGTAVAEGALMIDMGCMNDIAIDPEARTARVGGGATWVSLDAAAQVHGLATPGGVVSSTGVGGLTLGGGFGWLSRRFGLACDNLLSVDLVLADGRVVTASDGENPDLFWAIRGGSGNFGIATAFTFHLHPIGPDVLFGPTFFALEDASHVLAAYARASNDLPREASVWANIMTAPPVPILPEPVHGTKVLNLVQCFNGDPDQGRDVLTPLYGGAKPLGDGLARRPYTEAQSFLDAAYDKGARNYWRAHNHAALTPELINTLVDLAPSMPTPASEILIVQLGGAIADVPADATAFPHRDVPFVSTPGVRWEDAEDDAPVINWLQAASARLAEHAIPGAYVNFITETAGTGAVAYGANLGRLSEIKRLYDPGNLFRANQNIAPSAEG